MTTAALTDLRGVGPALATRLGRLGVHTALDLLFILPLRYEDRTRVTPLGGLLPGRRAVVEATVELSEVVFRQRRALLCRISDGTGILTLRFFYFSRSQQAALARGRRVRCYGEVRKGPGGLEMVHPEYRVLADAAPEPLEAHLTPVYPTTEGVQQGRLRSLIAQALDTQLQHLQDYLPGPLLRDYQLPELADAVRYLHRPPAAARVEELLAGQHPTQQRLALEELLAHQLSLRQLRRRAMRLRAPALRPADSLSGGFLANLPFALTGDQQRALDQVCADLTQEHPMMRLVQGDVGCGKTVVAAAAALWAVSAGAQVAVMAPTELLAEQHRNNFTRWCAPLGVSVAWLTGSLKSAARREATQSIAAGTAQIVVGTHALFQESVEFARLGLVIVDEQHRFGVHQRMSLMEKGATGRLRPHQLVMTATPIPRTLAMTMYADLDVSVIREMPPGRQAVTTVAVSEQRRHEVIARVSEAVAGGARAYWVCPLVEESEQLDYQDAESTHGLLREALPELAIGLIHGRMRAEQKDAVMQAFAGGELHVLVATTVIEVGVDVPEATLMIIENAERMGLAQLHQLRGRVGRGSAGSSCVLLYRPPLSSIAQARLGVLRDTNDGFVVAEKDLELRGPGEVLGKRQTGMLHLRVADLSRDAALLPKVQRLADEILAAHPEVAAPLIARWIGAADQYGNV
ncbi:MAG: ATP-dependent DNA helicase RecG [Gammaproteobacteria bacterium]|jgi:ATP-dependent DNA helicase RecG|nr:ATP-dependent DNA helicase RecG [Gammaproteobacteria bacterium]